MPDTGTTSRLSPPFSKWEEGTRGTARLLIAEGDQSLWGLGETPEHAIREHYSEVGLMCLFAETNNIPIVSGEPVNYAEIAQLMLEFPPEEVLLHYGIIQIPLLNEATLDEYMEGHIFPSYARKLGRLALTLPDSHPLHDFEFTYPHFLHLYKAHFNEVPDANGPELTKLYLSITSAQMESAGFASQAIARIAPRRMQLRDGHLGALIGDRWRRGMNIFSWYGLNHTLALDAYLARLGRRNMPMSNDCRVVRETESGYLLAPSGLSGVSMQSLRLHTAPDANRSPRSRQPLWHVRDANSLWATPLKTYLHERTAEPITPTISFTSRSPFLSGERDSPLRAKSWRI